MRPTFPIPRPAAEPRIVAHRGASGEAPENTLAAIARAAAQGASWVEVDVALLGDGTAVLSHDATLERCTNARGALADLVAADLAGLDAGSWFAAAFAGEALPTLAAALGETERRGLSINLEMKPHGAAPDRLAAALGAAMANRARLAGRVVVSSFDLDALAALRGLMPNIPIAALWEAAPEDWEARAAALRAEAIHLDHRLVGPELIQAAREAGVAVRVYTANDPDAVAGLRDAGLGAVVTDHPPRYLGHPDWRDWAEAR